MRIIDIIFSSIKRVRVSRPPLFSLLFSLFSSRSQDLDKFLFVEKPEALRFGFFVYFYFNFFNLILIHFRHGECEVFVIETFADIGNIA